MTAQAAQALSGLVLWMLGAGVGAWFSVRVYRKHNTVLRRLVRDKLNGYRQMIARTSVRQSFWRLIVVGEAILVGLIVALLPASGVRGLIVMVAMLAIIWTVAWSAIDQDRYLDRIVNYPKPPDDKKDTGG